MSEPRTVEHLLKIAGRLLEDSTHIFEGHDLDAEARDLLALALRREADAIRNDEEVPVRSRERFLSLVARRAAGEPFPILMGYIEFDGLRLEVSPGAFIPRPSSELTVEWAEKRLKKRISPIVIDVCTGAGPIALALAKRFPDADVWGSDILEEGLRQGRRNAKKLGIPNVSLVAGDMFDALPARLEGDVDLVTGHVPYVATGELEDLPSEVRDHEPVSTLSDESDDGLFLLRRAVEEGWEWLKPGGWLLLELADDLSDVVEELMLHLGYSHVGTVADDDDLSVVVEGRKPARKRAT